jgi:hypothetical protein
MTDPYASVKAHFRAVAGVDVSEGRGAQGLKIGTKMFAMFFKGDLLLTLPPDRVQALISTGRGLRSFQKVEEAGEHPGYGGPGWVGSSSDRCRRYDCGILVAIDPWISSLAMTTLISMPWRRRLPRGNCTPGPGW